MQLFASMHRPMWLLLALAASCAAAAAAEEPRSLVMTTPDALRWETRSSGVRVAVLYGDPKQPGPFVLRLDYPPGYVKGPHYHPRDAIITVLGGAYARGYGDRFEKSGAYALTPATFSLNPAGASHYEWTDGGATLQVLAYGPWATTYVDDTGAPIVGVDTRPATGRYLPIVRAATDLEWKRRDAGGRVAMLQGDPGQPGPFTMRVQLEPGHGKPAHAHPSAAFVTVLSGTLHLGFGAQSNPSQATPMPAGSFVLIPAGLTHYEWTTETTVVEVHGRGPWTEGPATASTRE